MRLLVFQHLEVEHPGVLRRFLAADGIAWDAVRLDQGQPIPPLDGYDQLWVMGGPMDVWDVDEHPWLVPEKAAIRHWVRELQRPFLGVCLGHQLLADALGGTCGPQRPPEVGILEVELTAAGRADPLFAGLPDRQPCLQWHSVRVAQPPEGAVVLARSRRLRLPGDPPRPPCLRPAVPCRAGARDHPRLGCDPRLRGRPGRGAGRGCPGAPRGRPRHR